MNDKDKVGLVALIILFVTTLVFFQREWSTINNIHFLVVCLGVGYIANKYESLMDKEKKE